MAAADEPAPTRDKTWWAFLEALGREDVATVARLVDGGVDLAREDGVGRHALVTAAQTGNPELVSAVLRRESPQLARDRALVEAAAHGHVGVVEVLLASGANPSFVTERGNSALGIARKRKRREVALLLTARGVTVASTRAVKRSVPAPPEVSDRTLEEHAALAALLRSPAAAKRRSAAKKIGATRDAAFEGVLVAALAHELEDVRAWEGQVEMAKALGAISSDPDVAGWLERVFVEVRFESTVVPAALAGAAFRAATRAGRVDVDRLLAVATDEVQPKDERLAVYAGLLEAATEARARLGPAIAGRVGAFIADPGELPRHGEAMLAHARRAWAAHVALR